MSKPKRKKKVEKHELYKKKDFTKEDVDSGNIIAIAVVEHKRKICKRCRKQGAALDGPCEKGVMLKRAKVTVK